MSKPKPLHKASEKPLHKDSCTSELWEGVRCTLPAGHQGSHQRPATDTSCAISWRSSTFPPPVPAKPARPELPAFRLFVSQRPTMELIR